MTSPIEPPQPGDGASRPGLLETLAKNHKEIGYGLFGLAAVFAVLPIALLVHYGWPKAMSPVFAWSILITLTALAAALIGSFRAPDAKLSEVEKLRLVLIFLGGTVGLLTALLGLALPFFQYSAVFAGGAAEWRKNPVALWTTALAFIGGLGLTFASLQVGRGQERENALMRRLLYGFNAVFSTLLLAAILLLINVLPYLPQLGAHDFIHKFLDGTFDWTQSRIYSLSDRTKNTLTGLKEPVKVYILMDNGDPIAEQIKTLLDNCRNINPQLSWEQVSGSSLDRLEQLPAKLRGKILDPRHGLLVVYGDEAKEQGQFVLEDTLYQVQPDEAGGRRLLFQGEGTLMQTIRSLTENAEKKPIVYFTQGDGELDFNDAREDSADGMGAVVKIMHRTEVYDLQELKFSGDVTAVPADAEAVVVARPQRMKPAALKALYNYMGYDYDEAAKAAVDLPSGQTRRNGKMFVLLDVMVQDKQMLQTGLEPLLAKFAVQPGNDRVLTLQDPAHPTEIEAATSRTSRNPVAKTFAAPNRVIFRFNDVRSMKPAFGEPGPFAAEELVVTDSEPVWEETDLVTRPAVLAEARIKQPGAKYSDTPISLAVAVSERKSDMPNDPTHAALSASEGRPRMVAFGNADWASNAGLLTVDFQAKYPLFISCLSWLREKPDIGATPVEADETKARVPYHPTITDDASWTIQLLPLGHMILAIIAGGIGVWLVRRR